MSTGRKAARYRGRPLPQASVAQAAALRAMTMVGAVLRCAMVGDVCRAMVGDVCRAMVGDVCRAMARVEVGAEPPARADPAEGRSRPGPVPPGAGASRLADSTA